MLEETTWRARERKWAAVRGRSYPPSLCPQDYSSKEMGTSGLQPLGIKYAKKKKTRMRLEAGSFLETQDVN